MNDFREEAHAEEFHRRIPDYEITPGDQVAYTNYGVRAAVRLPVTFPVR